MGLRIKLIIGILLIAFMASGATGSYFYFQSEQALYKALQEELKAASKIAAKLIDGDALQGITQQKDFQTKAYKQIQSLMGQIAQSNEEFIYAYTMRNVNGKVSFIVDSPASDDNQNGIIEPNEYPAAIGEVYPNPPQSLLQGFSCPSADKRPWKDKWGWFISGYAPVFNKSGQSVGLLGIDMNVLRVNQKLWLIKRAGYISLAGALVLSLLLTIYYSKQFMRPIRHLEKGVQKVANGDYNTLLNYVKKDELGRVISGFNGMIKELKEKHLLKTSLGKVMDKEVVNLLVQEEFKLGGEMAEAVFMFCDLRSFTELSRKLPPVLLVKLLNDYFTSMISIIEEYGGIVDKFVGDALMAVFGHPKEIEFAEEKALLAALKMLQACDELNQKQQLQDFSLVNSVGIHNGSALAGIIGSPDRAEYTFIGSAVNTASRLETLTRQLNTRLAVSGDFYYKLQENKDILVPEKKLWNVGKEKIHVYSLVSNYTTILV